jgi:hypothetical protein
MYRNAPTGVSDSTFTVDVTTPSSGDRYNPGVIFRVKDSLNYWYFGFYSGPLSSNDTNLYEVVNGNYTLRGSASFTAAYSTTYELKVITSGNTIDSYINGVRRFSYSSTTHQTEIGYGLREYRNDFINGYAKYDNFRVKRHTTLVSDTFSDPTPTSLHNRYPDLIGASAWTKLSTTADNWQVSGGKVNDTGNAASGGHSIALIDAGASNVTMTMRVNVGERMTNGLTVFAFRSDATLQNGYLAGFFNDYASPANILVSKKVNGSETDLVATSVASSGLIPGGDPQELAEYDIKIVCSGSSVTIYVKLASSENYTLVTSFADSSFNSQTRFGIYTYSDNTQGLDDGLTDRRKSVANFLIKGL